jgi:hypothetical protein
VLSILIFNLKIALYKYNLVWMYLYNLTIGNHSTTLILGTLFIKSLYFCLVFGMVLQNTSLTFKV